MMYYQKSKIILMLLIWENISIIYVRFDIFVMGKRSFNYFRWNWIKNCEELSYDDNEDE